MDAAMFLSGMLVCLTSMVAGGALVIVGLFAARRFGSQPALVGESRVMLPSYPARAYPGRARIETFSTRVHSSTYQQISRLLLESEYTLDSVRYVNGGTLIDIEAHRVIA